MTKIYIPQVGEELKLIKNWNCKVFNEHRNYTVFNALNLDNSDKDTNIDIVLPKDTVLRLV